MRHALFEAQEQDSGDQTRQPLYHNPVHLHFSIALCAEEDELLETNQ